MAASSGLSPVELLLDSHPVEAEVSGDLGRHTAEVVSDVSDALSLGDGDEDVDSAEASGVLLGRDRERRGPVGSDGGAEDKAALENAPSVPHSKTAPNGQVILKCILKIAVLR